MNDFTFLTDKQVFGDNQLEIFKKRGASAAITDFSILLGGFVDVDSYYNEGNPLNNRTGKYCTSSPDSVRTVYTVSYDATPDFEYVYHRNVDACSILPYSLISSICSNRIRGKNGIIEVEYREYPQTIVYKN